MIAIAIAMKTYIVLSLTLRANSKSSWLKMRYENRGWHCAHKMLISPFSVRRQVRLQPGGDGEGRRRRRRCRGRQRQRGRRLLAQQQQRRHTQEGKSTLPKQLNF